MTADILVRLRAKKRFVGSDWQAAHDEIERLRAEVARLRRDCRTIDVTWSDGNAALGVKSDD